MTRQYQITTHRKISGGKTVHHKYELPIHAESPKQAKEIFYAQTRYRGDITASAIKKTLVDIFNPISPKTGE